MYKIVSSINNVRECLFSVMLEVSGGKVEDSGENPYSLTFASECCELAQLLRERTGSLSEQTMLL